MSAESKFAEAGLHIAYAESGGGRVCTEVPNSMVEVTEVSKCGRGEVVQDPGLRGKVGGPGVPRGNGELDCKVNASCGEGGEPAVGAAEPFALEFADGLGDVVGLSA